MFRIASSPRGVAAPITATILLAATTCGCDSPPPDERLAGVPLTEELRPAVEASRRSLRLGDTGDPVVRAELARYLELAAMLSRNDRRAAAEDSLYTLWSRDLDGILWPDLVAFNRNRFSDLARLQSLFEHPEFPDSSTALGAYLREWRRIGPRPDGSGYAVARNARAELTPFQDVWFGLRLARFVRQSGNADEAARIAIETLPAARRVGGWRLESKAWTEVSRTLAATADLDGALHAAVLAEDLAIDEFSVLEARFQRADVLAERRDVEPALALYEVCVAEALDSGFGSLAGDVLNRAGIFTSTVGRYEEGLAVYQRALAVAIADGDSLNVPRHLANIGRRYLILGELDSCRVYLEEAEQWIRAHPDPSNLARFPLFQAEYRAQIGDFEAVDSLHALAAEITPSSSPIHELAELHLEVIRQGTESGRPGRVYRSLSHLDSLRTRLRSSFADRNELFDLDLAVADFLGRQGVFVRAAKALDRAEMSLLSRPDPARTWQLTAARGHLARRRDDATAAESAYVACISMSRGLDGEDRLALSQLWLASHHLEQGHLDAATSIMDAGPAARFDRRFRTRLSAALLRAAVDSRAGRFRAARKGLERARELCPPTSATDLLVRLDLETGRALAGLGKTREARESFARARDRLLTDRRSFRVGNEIFLDRDLRRELAEAMLDVALPRSRPQLKGEEASAALRDVAGLLPAWRASRDITTRRLAELQILFFAGAGSTYRWTVRAGEVTLQRLPGEDMLTRAMAPVLSDLREPARRPIAGDIEALTEILGGAIPRAAGMELIIVPDGPLYSVPWAALSSGDETWIDPGPISIADAPVVREAEDRGRPVRDLRLLALGVDGSPPARAAGLPALRSAEREAQEVSARWPRGNVTLSVGASAGRSAFLGDQLSEYDVIHIASHAQAFQGLVDQTTLFVAGATDAPVTASEIRRLPLNAELVFLSCCEAAGGIRRGVGPAHAGLARSFLEAGARHVIASGIRVDDDAARELAVRFYEHWLDGVEISDALRMAQLDLREGRWAHPYYWAFYQVISAYPPGGGAGGSGPVSQSEK